MPIVLRQEGYVFVIRLNDHEPAHVHVFEGDGEAKIDLDPVEVRQVWNMKKQVVRRAKEIVIDNQQYLLQRWEEIHGR